jgi:hypothetical protein
MPAAHSPACCALLLGILTLGTVEACKTRNFESGSSKSIRYKGESGKAYEFSLVDSNVYLGCNPDARVPIGPKDDLVQALDKHAKKIESDLKLHEQALVQEPADTEAHRIIDNTVRYLTNLKSSFDSSKQSILSLMEKPTCFSIFKDDPNNKSAVEVLEVIATWASQKQPGPADSKQPTNVSADTWSDDFHQALGTSLTKLLLGGHDYTVRLVPRSDGVTLNPLENYVVQGGRRILRAEDLNLQQPVCDLVMLRNTHKEDGFLDFLMFDNSAIKLTRIKPRENTQSEDLRTGQLTHGLNFGHFVSQDPNRALASLYILPKKLPESLSETWVDDAGQSRLNYGQSLRRYLYDKPTSSDPKFEIRRHPIFQGYASLYHKGSKSTTLNDEHAAMLRCGYLKTTGFRRAAKQLQPSNSDFQKKMSEMQKGSTSSRSLYLDLECESSSNLAVL